MTYLHFKVEKKWNFITDLHINLLLCFLQSCTECGTSNQMAALLPVTATSKDKNNFQTHSGSLRLDCPDAQLWLITEAPWMSDSSLTASCLCRSLWRLRLEEKVSHKPSPTPPPQKLNFTPLTSEGKQETLPRIPESVTSGFFHGTKTHFFAGRCWCELLLFRRQKETLQRTTSAYLSLCQHKQSQACVSALSAVAAQQHGALPAVSSE